MRVSLNYKKRLKNNSTRLFLSTVFCFLSISCTSHPKTKDLLTVAAATAVGATVGAALSPEYEAPENHAFVWGSFAGITSAFLVDLRSSQNIAEREARVLKSQLELERLLKPSTAQLLSEGTVRRTGVLFDQTIPAGTRYKLYERSSLQIAETPLRVYEIRRELELTFPKQPGVLEK